MKNKIKKVVVESVIKNLLKNFTSLYFELNQLDLKN